MKRTQLFAIVLIALLALAVVPAAAQDEGGPPRVGLRPIVVSPQGVNWWVEAAKPYAGVVLRGVSESTPPSNYVKNVLAPRFKKLTGIKVELDTTSLAAWYDKAIRDIESSSGIYDFVYIEQDIIYSWLANNYLVNITQALKDKPELAAADFSFADFTTFIDYFKNADGDVFGIPMEAFIKIYLYRTDLFNDPKIKEEFKAKYGWGLAPATTHEQYTQIAEFFTEYGEANDIELWGTTVQAASAAERPPFYEVFESVLPTYGVYNWGINMDNWKATSANGGMMDSDQAKAALTWWLDLLKYAPPEATSSTWYEVAASFAAGRAAQGLVYGENVAWIATNAEKSKVAGNVGVALPPLEPGVLDDAKAGKGYIGYYDGGAFGLPVSSKNQDAALLWLQFVGLPENQADWAVAGSRITQTSTFDDPKVQEADAKTNGYFTMLEEQGYLFAGAPPFPFHPQVREVIAPFIYRAIGDEIPPAEALDQAAAAIDEELVRWGYGR